MTHRNPDRPDRPDRAPTVPQAGRECVLPPPPLGGGHTHTLIDTTEPCLSGAGHGLTLRPYQREALDAVFRWLSRIKAGKADRSGVVALPTGAGKTALAGAIIAEVLRHRPEARFLFVAHRVELLEQTAATFARVGLADRVGVVSAGLGRRELDAQIVVAGVQSVHRRAADLGARQLVFLDEAHLVAKRAETMFAKLRDALRETNPDICELGLTATPWRLDGGIVYGRDRQFSELVHAVDVADLTAAGWLAPLRAKSTERPIDVHGVAKRAGDFIRSQLEARVLPEDVVRAAAAEATRLAADRRAWLVFCVTRAHAHAVRDALRDLEVDAEVLLGDTPPEERADLVERFRAGEVRALVGVDVLTTGFDAPVTDAIVMLRPTASTGLYAQQLGRGLRLHDGKADCLLLDFAGNVARHGPLDALQVHAERAAGKRRKRRKPPPTKECEACREIVLASVRECPGCGSLFPLETIKHAAAASAPEDVREVEVLRVSIMRHDKPNKPPSLRVSYHTPVGWCSEWVCPEHPGFSKKKARWWWRERQLGRMPATVDEMVERPGLPEQILAATVGLRVDVAGKYPKLIGHRLAEPAGAW